QLAAALEAPLAPRRDDPDPRAKVVRGELEANLVVALAGRAVRDRVGALGIGRFPQPAADARARQVGAHQVLTRVERAGAQRRPHVVAHELEALIANDRLL